VRIPLVLTRFTNGKSEVQVQAATVRDLVDVLEASYPGVKTRLCNDKGELRNLLNFFVNNKDIRFLNGPETPLNDGDHISIVPLIAGG
jgi:molybdopterin synthase sulfur carrier subunit